MTVFTFFFPFSVVTVAVTWTVIELEPLGTFLLTLPERTPSFESFIPLGKETFFHLSLVA